MDSKVEPLLVKVHTAGMAHRFNLDVSYCSWFFGGGGLQGGQDRIKARDFPNRAGALPLFVLSRSGKVVFRPVLSTPLAWCDRGSPLEC